MPIPIPQGEDTIMNMTPMIDICFQLVVFLMLTLDMSSKEYAPLTLPFANHGVEDKDDPNDPIMSLKLIVNVLPDGKIILKGNEYPFTIDNPEGSMKAIKALHQELMNLTASDSSHPGVKSDDQHTNIPIQVHGDRAALWRYTQWIIATAASPQTKMYKIFFSVKDASDEEPAPAGGP